MRRAILFLMWVCSIPNLYADPIEDLSMKPYVSGWYPNFYKGEGPLNCAQTCRYWTRSRMEYERSSDIDGQSRYTSVCKITRDPAIIEEPINDPSSHWLYGNQFDSYPKCLVQSLGYGSVSNDHFMCLCVRPTCQKPDLVITKIHRPVWDHANTRSIVKVEIKNIGASVALNFATELKDPGTGASSAQVTPVLAPNTTATLTFYFGYWVYDPDAELIGVVDSSNRVKECNERNNLKRFFEMG